jgi:LAO/AO transport system kinase
VNADVIDRIIAGDIYALSKAISVAENRKAGYVELMDAVHRHNGRSRTPVIGITGSPGAGKSTCINALLGRFAEAGKRAAVVAVDPSSRFSGGAFLGDRVRMADDWDMSRVFFRSIASRGDLGGLSRSVIDITDLYAAAGYDIIMVESVGVGQNEIEIRDVADHVFLMMVEGMGDEIQFLKAGIMEVADYFVFTKVDSNPPGRSVRQLLQSGYMDENKYLFQVDSVSGTNIDDLAGAIMEISVPGQETREAAGARNRHVAARLIEEILGDMLDSGPGSEAIDRSLSRGVSPYELANQVKKRMEGIWEDL